MISLCHNYIKRVPNGGILYLAADPESTKGQDCHSGSKEQPDEVHDARNMMASVAELATKKAASNRVRVGGSDSLAMDADFYQRDVL